MVRAQVVLLQDDRILLARHEKPDHTYWVLPGGAVEAGESPAQAAMREVREETGLEISIDGLLFVDGPRITPQVTIRSERYTFLGHIIGGQLRGNVSDEDGNEVNGRLTGSAWMPFNCADYDPATCDTLHRVSTSIKADPSPEE